MHKSRSIILGSLLIALITLLSFTGEGVIESDADAIRTGLSNGTPQSTREGFSETQVTLSAAHWTTSWDVRDPEQSKFDLPLLYLHREREETAKADRTLTINLSGLEGEAEIEVKVVSRHVSVSTGERHVETRTLLLPHRPCTSEQPCTVRWTFDPGTMLSDFYDLRVEDHEGHPLWENPYADRPDFVMLDTWDVGLGDYTVRIYYAALFPFARGQNDFSNRLSPDGVSDFVKHRFVPIIIDTWTTQLHTWGFDDPIQPDWDPDKVVEIVVNDPPFALFDGTGAYSFLIGEDGRPYPERRIWWLSSSNSFQVYDTLENGYKAVFAHEFFHLVQWNVVLSGGQPRNLWLNAFIEAQGRFAPSVQHPQVEIHRDHLVWKDSAYASAANHFLTLRLNASYRDFGADTGNKYDGALYWRFLYEQFHDMGIIRAALEEMTAHFEPDIVTAMPGVMNSAFARFDGPFHTFEDSLIGFARANYALCLENGRCAAADLAECSGNYYDPDNVYANPPLEAELDYDGSPLTYRGSIPSSFGMDFVEVRLDPALHRQPVTIRLQSEGTVARFNVQVWGLRAEGEKLYATMPQPEIIPQNSGQAHVYTIPRLDTTTYQKLALIITRLDPDETTDPVGSYQIVLDAERATY